MRDFGSLIDGVEKKVINAGNRDVLEFKNGSKITFHFQTQTLDENGDVRYKIDDSKEAGRAMELILGKQFKLPVWEACIKSMKLNEIAEFRVKKSLVDAYPLVSKSYREFAGMSKGKHKGHCCGMKALTEGVGHKDLDALLLEPYDLQFIIELLKCELPGEYEKESWSMDPKEKLQSIPELKEKGNELYKDKQYESAAKTYFEALGRLEQLLLREKPGEDEWVELEKLKVPILLNYAQCKLVQKDFYPVIEYTTNILEKEPENVKALYKRAKSYAGVWDLDLARQDFSRLGELDPSSQNLVQKELKNLVVLQKQKDDEIKSKLCGKIFSES